MKGLWAQAWAGVGNDTVAGQLLGLVRAAGGEREA